MGSLTEVEQALARAAEAGSEYARMMMAITGILIELASDKEEPPAQDYLELFE